MALRNDRNRYGDQITRSSNKRTFFRHRVYPGGLQAFALRGLHLNLEIQVVQRPVSTGINPVAELA